MKITKIKQKIDQKIDRYHKTKQQRIELEPNLEKGSVLDQPL